jgi:hypothetical protein
VLYESVRTAGANPSSDPDMQGAFDRMWPICLPYITLEWADIVPIFLGRLTSAVHTLPPGCSLTEMYDAQPVHPPAVHIVHPLPAVAPVSSLLTPVAAATSMPLSSAPSPIVCSGSSGSGLSQLSSCSYFSFTSISLPEKLKWEFYQLYVGLPPYS